MNVGTSMEAGRLLALRYMSLSEPEKRRLKVAVEEFATADLKPKSNWITAELEEWLEA